MRRVRWLVAGWLATLSLAFAPGVSAQDEALPAGTRERFELARAAFERGDFATALTDFERVYGLLDGHPRRALLLYNMARCNQELGRSRDALDLYERFLAESGENAPNRPEAQQHVSELRLRVSLDTTSDAPPPDGAGATTSIVGPIVLGVGGAMLIAGAITGGALLAEDGSLSAMCTDGVCPSAARERGETVEALANVTDALWIGGTVVAATGLVLTLVLRDESPPPTPVSAGCDSQGCGVQVRGTF